MDNDFNYSGEEDNSKNIPKVAPKKKLQKQTKAVFHNEVDTNVFKIQYNTLKNDKVEIATGDPIFCKGCQAVLNFYS